jgi:rubrerythrin
MANLPDIFVMRKSLSSEYQPYAPQGHFLRGACGKIFRTPQSRPNFPISGWALVGGFVKSNPLRKDPPMELKGTQTEKNLLLAYTGESNNRNMYTFFAEQAQKEGYEQIGSIFLETASHEYEHARQELNLIRTSDVELPSLVYPVKGVGTTLANLETAVSGENYEQQTMYPEFAQTAEEEGFLEIAVLFRNIAVVEAWHAKRFASLLNLVKQGRVFHRDPAVTWKCRACGYLKTDKSPQSVCPICDYDRAYFEVLDEPF